MKSWRGDFGTVTSKIGLVLLNRIPLVTLNDTRIYFDCYVNLAV
jgi:hypothetical protein